MAWLKKLFAKRDTGRTAKPNWTVVTFGTTSFGRIMVSRHAVHAESHGAAVEKAKDLAMAKEREIGRKNPNFSLYEDGSYHNSIGVSWELMPIADRQAEPS
jgi:hypothetical protein